MSRPDKTLVWLLLFLDKKKHDNDNKEDEDDNDDDHVEDNNDIDEGEDRTERPFNYPVFPMCLGRSPQYPIKFISTENLCRRHLTVPSSSMQAITNSQGTFCKTLKRKVLDFLRAALVSKTPLANSA